MVASDDPELSVGTLKTLLKERETYIGKSTKHISGFAFWALREVHTRNLIN